jgi:hypothetical protein
MTPNKRVAPPWVTPTVRALARQVRGRHGAWAVDLLPVLADACEEAGCADGYLLGLLRRPVAELFLVQLEVGRLLGKRAVAWIERHARLCGVGPVTLLWAYRAWRDHAVFLLDDIPSVAHESTFWDMHEALTGETRLSDQGSASSEGPDDDAEEDAPADPEPLPEADDNPWRPGLPGGPYETPWLPMYPPGPDDDPWWNRVIRGTAEPPDDYRDRPRQRATRPAPPEALW